MELPGTDSLTSGELAPADAAQDNLEVAAVPGQELPPAHPESAYAQERKAGMVLRVRSMVLGCSDGPVASGMASERLEVTNLDLKLAFDVAAGQFDPLQQEETASCCPVLDAEEFRGFFLAYLAGPQFK